MYEIELWEKYGGDKVLCAGVIDVKGRSLEPVEVVAERIRTCLRYCAREKLWVAPDCGFSQTVRWLAVEKMQVMVQAAKMVRGD
jgi:5-methyltetrahydropteroyltriglutamate--homocysteine methyltransferase